MLSLIFSRLDHGVDVSYHSHVCLSACLFNTFSALISDFASLSSLSERFFHAFSLTSTCLSRRARSMSRVFVRHLVHHVTLSMSIFRIGASSVLSLEHDGIAKTTLSSPWSRSLVHVFSFCFGVDAGPPRVLRPCFDQMFLRVPLLPLFLRRNGSSLGMSAFSPMAILQFPLIGLIVLFASRLLA